MVVILKKDLQKIWDYLEKQLTFKDRKWLKKHRPGIWKEFSKDGSPILDDSPVLWRAYHADTLFQLSFRIQEVLDAKRNKKEAKHYFGEGIPKEYVVELAQLLGLEVSEKGPKYEILERPKWEILNKILKKIEEQSQQRS